MQTYKPQISRKKVYELITISKVNDFSQPYYDVRVGLGDNFKTFRYAEKAEAFVRQNYTELKAISDQAYQIYRENSDRDILKKMYKKCSLDINIVNTLDYQVVLELMDKLDCYEHCLKTFGFTEQEALMIIGNNINNLQDFEKQLGLGQIRPDLYEF